MGLTQPIGRHVRVRPAQGWTDAEVVSALVLLNLAGGERVETWASWRVAWITPTAARSLGRPRRERGIAPSPMGKSPIPVRPNSRDVIGPLVIGLLRPIIAER